jgi:superfamily I DNA/RNA helicase
LEEFRKTRSGNATVFSLRTNCRNTPRIAELAQELAGPGFVYSKTLRSDDDIKPVISFYSTQEHQMALLIECLEKLRKDKVNGRNIVILSTRSNVNCIAAKVTEQAWRNRLKPYGTSNDPAAIGFCSIHAFKGMEALVAIVTDVESLDAVRSKSLFYVAVTRTLGPLFILANEKLKDAVPEILKTQRLS